MKPFAEIKQEILKRAKENDACEKQYKRAYQATSTEELLSVVKDNLRWTYIHMNVNAEFLEEYFGTEILNKNHIYTQGEHTLDIKNDQLNIFILGSSSANVETWGSSSKISFSVESDNSFIRHHNERKIYIKKDSFKIVEI